MIVRKENNTLKIKAVFNLDQDNLFRLEQDNFKLTSSSIIVELEVVELLGEKVISLEMITLGYPNIDAYKKFVITEGELCIGEGKIPYEKINDMYTYNKKDKHVISSIIVDTILSYNCNFFNGDNV